MSRQLVPSQLCLSKTLLDQLGHQKGPGSTIEPGSHPLFLSTLFFFVFFSFYSRREDKLRIPNGWLCHLAPELIQQLAPDTEEDKLPFSKQSDVFAFG